MSLLAGVLKSINTFMMPDITITNFPSKVLNTGLQKIIGTQYTLFNEVYRAENGICKALAEVCAVCVPSC